MTGALPGMAPTAAMGDAAIVLLGACAGALLTMGAREALLASPAAAAWLRQALEPLRRAGREGYAPSTLERRRLAALGALAAIVAGWLAGGLEVALPLSVAGPGIAAWAISSRRRRYRLPGRPSPPPAPPPGAASPPRVRRPPPRRPLPPRLAARGRPIYGRATRGRARPPRRGARSRCRHRRGGRGLAGADGPRAGRRPPR